MGGMKQYKERKQVKIDLYKKYDLNLIELSDKHVENLDDHLPRMLLKFDIKVFKNQTKEYDFGWIFFYQSSNEDNRLGGNGPLIVEPFTLDEAQKLNKIFFYFPFAFNYLQLINNFYTGTLLRVICLDG